MTPHSVSGPNSRRIYSRSAENPSRVRSVVLVANLGYGKPPNGQTQKARAVLDLLERSGRDVSVVDVGEGKARLLELVRLVRRGESLVVVLNRRGLWVALALIGVVRATTQRRGAVVVPVVGGWLPDYLRRSAYRRLARIVDEFLVETPRLQGALERHGFNAHELVNFRNLPADPERVRRAPAVPLRLCFAGRVREDKGVRLAAQLVERLDGLGVPCRLDIYGPVEDAAARDAACEVTGVEYRGTYRTADEALDVLSAYDFLVLPSSYEGECMPGVVVEACFAALPAVVSDWKDLPQVVMDDVTGYVCPLEGFVEAAATRIRAGLRDGALPRLSRNALEHAVRRFTEEAAREVLMDRVAGYEPRQEVRLTGAAGTGRR